RYCVSRYLNPYTTRSCSLSSYSGRVTPSPTNSLAREGLLAVWIKSLISNEYAMSSWPVTTRSLVCGASLVGLTATVNVLVAEDNPLLGFVIVTANSAIPYALGSGVNVKEIGSVSAV